MTYASCTVRKSSKCKHQCIQTCLLKFRKHKPSKVFLNPHLIFPRNLFSRSGLVCLLLWKGMKLCFSTSWILKTRLILWKTKCFYDLYQIFEYQSRSYSGKNQKCLITWGQCWLDKLWGRRTTGGPFLKYLPSKHAASFESTLFYFRVKGLTHCVTFPKLVRKFMFIYFTHYTIYIAKVYKQLFKRADN